MNNKLNKFKGGLKRGFKNQDDFKGKKGKFKKKELYKSKKKPWELIDEELAELQQRYPQIDSANIKKFTDFPLSGKTQEGLKGANYDTPTEIQQEAIGLALQGNDILGAAKTGSGKTLAFLIPILEGLYRLKWSQLDGLGALIISPTRELAYQTFEVLKKIGKFHDFSAGLVIGGKFLREERDRISRTNIVVCTPGRLLQHMDETVNFTADGLQMLVLDEADRILDLGFSQSMNAIITNLPSERQTFLFSATQTKSVKDLARLSLKDPMYVSVHENAEHSTPSRLEQNYIVCELHEKLSVLWSFLKSHLKSKILVFVSCCKQVKMVFETMRRLRPGVTILELHGGMNQLKRVDVYNKFCRKQNAVLFATDIAARGLDIPAVNWVIQLDCPEDANTYIHRVGRTARFEKEGESLLILLPSEERAMLQQLQAKKIPVERIRVNPKKMWPIQQKLDSLCASDPSFKELVQRAFVAYLRSVFLMGNKDVFDIHKLDTDLYARSLGLAISPKIRFLQREKRKNAKVEKIISRPDAQNVKSSSDSEDSEKGHSEKMDSSESENSDVSSSESEDSEDSDSENNCSHLDVNSSENTGKVVINKEQNLKNESEKAKIISDSSDDENSDSSATDSEAVIHANRSAETERTQKHMKSATSGSSEKTNKSKNNPEKTFNFDVTEDDELFTVKRNMEIDEEEVDDIKLTKPSADKKKPLSKFATAKKLQKKNVKVNTKVVFDDDGEILPDAMKQSVLVQAEYVENEGGINIEVAKRHMKEEDKFDKKLYRERITAKHKQERIKKKEKERAKKKIADSDSEVEAILGQDEDMGNPLDFIPDPDKLYGSDSEGSVDGSDSSGSDSSDDDEEEEEDGGDGGRMQTFEPSVKKRKKNPNKYTTGHADGAIMDTGLSLYDDEEIALKLLQK
ncbi:hypothetical protein ScPMuIL_012606 [Solemya velum]